ncbi:MAG: HD-GYP domain-containing protein [Spirochaetes bacterium]|nr:HD-GYP domain-containing protein [Spirochaetota bacterium]
MKKKFPIEQLRVGMKFTADVLVDDKNLLVPAEIAIRQKDIETLKKWGITHIFSEGEPVAETLPDAGFRDIEVKSAIAPAFGGDRELYRSYMTMSDRLTAVFAKIILKEPVEPRNVDDIAQDILKIVREKSSIVTAAVLGDVQGSNERARGGINSAILSVVMGLSLKLPPYKLSHLATGALLHDTGMLRLPDSIVRKKGDLTGEEVQKIHAHPLLSYRIITKELFYPEDVGIIGLQHHERWDGEGYPRRTAGPEIDVLSRIVSTADAFEAMVSEKPYRNSIIGYQAMKNLLSDNGRRFDPEILKAFIRSMGIYPIGSLVLLNNAAIARVLETHAESPLRPKLRIIVDEFGKNYKDEDGDMVDLAAEKTLFIARAIDPKEFLGS